MSDSESPNRLREASPQLGASGSASPSASRWWWLHRHLHVPVVVWIVASVLGGAAIGHALEPDGTTDQAPTPVEVVSEPIVAVRCADPDVDADADVDGPSHLVESGALAGGDADRPNVDCD